MTPHTLHYAVISAVKNEEQYIGETIQSMIMQTAKPLSYTIVDDASTDGTARIVKQAMATHPWIHYLLIPGSAKRKTGSAEILAFNHGYETIRNEPFDCIVKLDGDLRFNGDYFERLLAYFAADTTLGIASGIYWEEANNGWQPVTMPDYHAAGASKIVRRECFDKIKGFIAERGWDTVDEIRAQAHGFITRHFSDVWFYHLRKEGTGMGQVHTNVMHGEIFYRCGGMFWFFLLKALARLITGRPFIVAPVAMIYGYCAALVRRKKMLVSSLEAYTYQRMLSKRVVARLRKLLFIRQ